MKNLLLLMARVFTWNIGLISLFIRPEKGLKKDREKPKKSES